MDAPVHTIETWIASGDPGQRARLRDLLFAWRTQHAADLLYSFTTTSRDGHRREDGRRARRVAVIASRRDLADTLPAGVEHRPIAPLEPLVGLAADTWDRTYDHRGATIHGTKHFAPGQTVYFHGTYSGDGFERAFATGIHRDTGRYCTIMCATSRFVRWRAELVEDPVAIYHLQHPIGYRGDAPRAWIDSMAAGMNARLERTRGGPST